MATPEAMATSPWPALVEGEDASFDGLVHFDEHTVAIEYCDADERCWLVTYEITGAPRE